MIELSRHIEALLLENDCVIIPGLGGFVAHTERAGQLAEEGRFMPPTRLIGFNPQLKLNDGLLVQSFMSVYGYSFPDATRLVENKVKKLQACLHEQGCVELPNIGELCLSLHESYSFHPYDHRLTTPSLYGWDELIMKELSPLPETPVSTVVPEETASHQPQRPLLSPRHYRRLRQFATQAATALAMLILVCLSFYISTPIQNTEIAHDHRACLSPAAWMIHPSAEQPQEGKTVEKTTLDISKSVTRKPISVTKTKTVTRTAEAQPATGTVPVKKACVSVEKPATTQQPAPTQPAKPTVKPTVKVAQWHIIVASMSTEKDAHQMASKLVGEGHKGARALIGDGKMRVSIDSYSSEAEAYQVLDKLRQQPAYQGAWVLRRK